MLTGMPWIVPIVLTSCWSSARWRVSSTFRESGEEEVEGRGCGLVDVVNSVVYHSRLSANSGISIW